MFEKFGGPEGIRTLDLFHAMEARSQLRHRPTPTQQIQCNTLPRAVAWATCSAGILPGRRDPERHAVLQ